MTTREKNRNFDLSYGDDNFNLTSSNNVLKVSSGIKLPNDNQSLFSAENSRTRYTISATIDEIKKVLASVRSNDYNNDDDNDIDDRIYYYQAYDFQKLGLYKREDAPAFKIKLSHLPEDIIYELSTLDESTRRFVLKQAVSRIFEDINYDLYHDSISSRLEVSLVD
jgi:hypothetical protein